MRTRIKICGLTRIQDAETAVQAGADAVGMIFYNKSPRYISLELAKSICSSVQPFVTTVAVVVDPDTEFLKKLERQTSIDRMQFHGAESPRDCEKASRPYYKVIRVNQQTDLVQLSQLHSNASALMLDTYVKGIPGGTGKVFDWELIEKQPLDKPVILAGGLSPDNVSQAITRLRPYAVDVSSAVEAKPGIKDAAKVKEFIIAVREADQALIRR